MSAFARSPKEPEQRDLARLRDKYKPDVIVDCSTYKFSDFPRTGKHGFSERHVGQTYTIMFTNKQGSTVFIIRFRIDRVPDSEEVGLELIMIELATFDSENGDWATESVLPENEKLYAEMQSGTNFGTDFGYEIASTLPVKHQDLVHSYIVLRVWLQHWVYSASGATWFLVN